MADSDYLAFARWFADTPRFPNDGDVERTQAYKRVFGTPEGRRVLRDMLFEAGVFSPSRSLEPQVLAAREGASSVVLRVLTLLNYNPKPRQVTDDG